MLHLHLLLATSRDAVERFYRDLQPTAEPTFTLAVISIGPESVPEHARELAWASVVAVDVSPDPDAAVEVCHQLRRDRPELPIVALLGCPGVLRVRQWQALRDSGVTSLLDSQVGTDQIPRLIARVARGDAVVHVDLRHEQSALIGGILGSATHGPRSAAEALTDTDVETLQLFLQGLTDDEVGQHLSLSEHTVRHRIDAIRAKVGERTRVGLAAWAGWQGFYQR